ncbi:MAG: hypothetical protein IJ605_03245 [Prevotella sp.]|nr:hypothetical protein [Prevotella sp.]
MRRNIMKWSMLAMVGILLSACSENYSRGEKVGTVIEFAESGLIWNSWDGRLNLTQTGMNTAGEPFTFSLDNDRNDQQNLVDLLYQAQIEGWKIKVKYHKVMGWNWFGNRGRSDYFVDDVTVLDKNFANPLKNIGGRQQGQVVDTIFVVIDKSQLRQK